MTSSSTPTATDRTSFPIRIGRLTRLYLIPWGIWSERRAEVAFDDDEVVIRFGWFGARIALADIERWDRDGPYKWIRAVGLRHTLFKNDVSFLGSAEPAIRLWLRKPRRIAWVRHATLVYAGVEDLDGFGAELTRRSVPGPAAPATV